MSEPIFDLVRRDPTLIKGIDNTCDQWCMYCRATARCLAYRSNPDIQAGKQDIHKELGERLYEGMLLFKRLNEAEGTPTPEVDALLAGCFPERPPLAPADAPLDLAASRYAHLCDAYLLSRDDFPFAMVWRPTGPTPFEVFAWFHAIIAGRVYRALTSSAAAVRGEEAKRAEALISAKVALIGIDRSLSALTALGAEDDDPRLELLSAHLRRLGRELESRFPDARGFVREGLDD